MPDAAFLTERQERWFAAVRDGLERETGHNLGEWADIARACPETTPRKRLAWMKAEHGLGQNRASIILEAAFPAEAAWSEADTLAAKLWVDPAARAINDAIREAVLRLPDIVVGQRKSFTAYSRNFQFCALRPARGGAVLGLALTPETDTSLLPRGNQPWSERLLSDLPLETAASVTDAVSAWLRAAWDRS
jgi:hypothetical protein